MHARRARTRPSAAAAAGAAAAAVAKAAKAAKAAEAAQLRRYSSRLAKLGALIDDDTCVFSRSKLGLAPAEADEARVCLPGPAVACKRLQFSRSNEILRPKQGRKLA